jgi:hypothetical protein
MSFLQNMSIINYLNRPEYFFRPKQIITRLKLNNKVAPASETFNLPWGVKIINNTHIL